MRSYWLNASIKPVRPSVITKVAVIMPAASIDSIVNSSDVSAANATAAMDFIGCTAMGMSNIMPVAMLEIPERTKVLRRDNPYLSARTRAQSAASAVQPAARSSTRLASAQAQRARVPWHSRGIGGAHWMLSATTIGM